MKKIRINFDLEVLRVLCNEIKKNIIDYEKKRNFYYVSLLSSLLERLTKVLQDINGGIDLFSKNTVALEIDYYQLIEIKEIFEGVDGNKEWRKQEKKIKNKIII